MWFRGKTNTADALNPAEWITTKEAEVTFVQCCLQSLGLYAHLLGLLSLKQAESNVPQDGHILRGATLADPAGILPEEDIQDPMNLILDLPMAPRGVQSLLDIIAQTCDVIARLLSGCCPNAIPVRR